MPAQPACFVQASAREAETGLPTARSLRIGRNVVRRLRWSDVEGLRCGGRRGERRSIARSPGLACFGIGPGAAGTDGKGHRRTAPARGRARGAPPRYPRIPASAPAASGAAPAPGRRGGSAVADRTRRRLPSSGVHADRGEARQGVDLVEVEITLVRSKKSTRAIPLHSSASKARRARVRTRSICSARCRPAGRRWPSGSRYLAA